MEKDRFTEANGSDRCHKLAVQSHNPELCNFLIKAGADQYARTFGYVPVPKRSIADIIESD